MVGWAFIRAGGMASLDFEISENLLIHSATRINSISFMMRLMIFSKILKEKSSKTIWSQFRRNNTKKYKKCHRANHLRDCGNPFMSEKFNFAPISSTVYGCQSFCSCCLDSKIIQPSLCHKEWPSRPFAIVFVLFWFTFSNAFSFRFLLNVK